MAVLIIDMQSGFLGDEKENIIPHQISIIKICQERDIPLVIIKYIGRGDINSDLQKEIRTVSNHYEVTKNSDNAFHNNELEDLLEDLKVEKLLIMGVNACACVLQTAKTAVEKGYQIIISDLLIAGCCPSCDRDTVYSWYKKNSQYFENTVPLFEK